MDEHELQGELLSGDVAPFTTAIAIAAAAPISYDNRVIGAIYAGSLLSGENALVRNVSKFTGGEAAVLLGDRIASSSIVTTDGSAFVNAAVPAAAEALRGSRYVGIDRERSLEYFVRIDPLRDTSGALVGALWFGVPLAQLDAISNNATRSMVIWGIVGLIVAIAIGVFLSDRISRAIVKRSHQVTQSAKELGVLVIGTEVSGDHVMQTRRKLEDVEQLLERIVPVEVHATDDARRLRALASEAHGDVIVIDTLAGELNERMQKAVRSVAQLNEVADGLNALVDGVRTEKT
jgi:methyl-accepting chemotaxis protein